MGAYQKGNRWYIDYYLPDGRRKREVVTVPGVEPESITRNDANKALHVRKAQLAEGKFDIIKTKKQITFDKLADDFIEHYSKVSKKSWASGISKLMAKATKSASAPGEGELSMANFISSLK